MVFRILLLTLVAALIGCGGDDPPPAPPLTDLQRVELAVAQANDAHAKAMAAARAVMLEAVEANLSKVAQTGDLDAAKAAAAERDAFKDSDVLPLSPELAAAGQQFVAARAAADKALVLSYEQSVKEYTKLLKLDEASALREQAARLRARHPAELFAEPPPVDPIVASKDGESPAKPEVTPPVTPTTPDPADAIDAGLASARAAHSKAIDDARKDLTAAYRAALPLAREKSAEIAAKLEAELAAFEKDQALPTRTALKDRVVEFIEKVRKADDDLASAYESAVQKYAAADRPAKAALVRDELARLQQRLVTPPEADDGAPPPPPSPTEVIEQAVNTARNTHASQLASARGTLLAEIEKQYVAATKTGDLALVKSLASAKENFEAHDEVPGGASFIVANRAFRNAARDANQTLAAAYDEAIKAYTKLDAVPLADALNEELQFLRQNPFAAARPIPGAILILSFDREDIYHRQNETRVRDRSIKRNDAKMTKLTLAPGKRGQAIECGSAQQAVITLEKTGIEGNAPRTISLWLLNRTPNNVSTPFIGIGDGCESRQFRLHSDSGNYILWGCGANQDFGVNLPVRDRWEHHAVAYDGQAASWYHNGALHKKLANHNYITVNSPLQIGGNAFRGLVDEVAVFNRALSDEEIAKLFKHGVR